MKFIIAQHELKDDFVELIPIIFPNNVVHKTIFDSLCNSEQYKDRKLICVSAGDIHLGFSISCSGHSESLKVACHRMSATVIDGIGYFSIFNKNSCPLNKIFDNDINTSIAQGIKD